MATDDRLLITPAEVAQRLGIEQAKCYALLTRGTIASITIGGLRRVPVAAFNAYVDAQASAAEPPEQVQSLDTLREEIAELRARVMQLEQQLSAPRRANPLRNMGTSERRNEHAEPSATDMATQEDLGVVERISMLPDDRYLLTPAEAARRLSISRSFCYRLMASGDLPSVVIGGRARRVPVQALKAYIEAQLADSTGESGR